jgi:hypothetical protein
MRKSIAWFILFLFCPFLPVYAQGNISFIEEHIDFELDSAYFSINGIYSFYNKSDREINQSILFPFAVKTSAIDSIKITNLNTSKKIHFSRLENTVSFDFTLLPKDTVDIHIFYRQKTVIKNTYIITSTQSWKKPLKAAVYTLTTPMQMEIGSFSYPPDEKEIINGKVQYLWEKKEFMPSFDFDVVLLEVN